MSETEKVREWVAFYKQSPLKYNMNALIAVYRNDGEKMLARVLRELGLESGLELVKDAAKNDPA